MSNHIIENSKLRWVFGWDQRYRSFFLIKHDKTISDDENPVIRLGAHPREIPTAEGLFVLALMAGLDIPHNFRLQLHHDKDHERSTYFVLHYPNEFVSGFETDSLVHAELLREALSAARPDQELQIRQIKEPY